MGACDAFEWLGDKKIAFVCLRFKNSRADHFLVVSRSRWVIIDRLKLCHLTLSGEGLSICSGWNSALELVLKEVREVVRQNECLKPKKNQKKNVEGIDD